MLEALPGVEVWQFFGQTEGSPICALSPDDHRAALAGHPELLRSVGRAAPEVELRAGDADSRRRRRDLRPRAAPLPARTTTAGCRTGDLGRIDEDGYVFLVGRKGDTINRGGENVRPLEVETRASFPSGRARRRGDRSARPPARRGSRGLRRRRATARGATRSGRAHGLRPLAPGRLQGAAALDVRRRPAAQQPGQGAAPGAARWGRVMRLFRRTRRRYIQLSHLPVNGSAA